MFPAGNERGVSAVSCYQVKNSHAFSLVLFGVSNLRGGGEKSRGERRGEREGSSVFRQPHGSPCVKVCHFYFSIAVERHHTKQFIEGVY